MTRAVRFGFSVAACAVLAACSPPEPTPEVEAAPAAAAQTASADPLPNTGSGLTGSVSGLSGDITAFQVTETANAIVVDLAADVLFDFDSATLSSQAPAQLQKTVAQIRRGGSGQVQVIGHTDSKGDDAYNDDLSLRRATAVATWLSSAGGVPAARLKSEGHGEREPVAPNEGTDGNDYPEGRAMNRRVQVIISRA